MWVENPKVGLRVIQYPITTPRVSKEISSIKNREGFFKQPFSSSLLSLRVRSPPSSCVLLMEAGGGAGISKLKAWMDDSGSLKAKAHKLSYYFHLILAHCARIIMCPSPEVIITIINKAQLLPWKSIR